LRNFDSNLKIKKNFFINSKMQSIRQREII